MFWYLFFATVPVITSIVVGGFSKKSIKTDDNTKRVFFVLCGFAMFLIIALRHNSVGSGDSLVYYNHWEKMSQYSYSAFEQYAKSARFEPGYRMFVWIFSHIFPEGQFAFVLSSLIFTISVCRFIYINSKDSEMSFVMYICLGLYTFMVQGLRQAIAMSICLFAIEFAKKRKLIPFMLLVLLATTFHTTALTFAVVYFLYAINLNWKTYILCFCGTAFLLAFSGPIAAFGSKIFEKEYEGEFETGGYVAVAIYVIIIAVSIVLAGKRKKEKDYSFFVLMTFMGLIIYILRYTEVFIAERISFYFMFGQIVALPNALSKLDKTVAFAIKCVVIVLCIALFAYRLSGDGLVSYKFLWQ